MFAVGMVLLSVSALLAPWLQADGKCRLVTLGTDGFGRSDNREHLRRHFEVNAESIVGATLSRLAREGKIKPKKAQMYGVRREGGTAEGAIASSGRTVLRTAM